MKRAVTYVWQLHYDSEQEIKQSRKGQNKVTEKTSAVNQEAEWVS